MTSNLHQGELSEVEYLTQYTFAGEVNKDA